ncbi:MAG TPA: hypothetical protein VFP80_14645, partial [Thermoanaerobaculia bacterium]|nr:hypothetical protein [Thermoanaerobaculia bacterium]
MKTTMTLPVAHCPLPVQCRQSHKARTTGHGPRATLLALLVLLLAAPAFAQTTTITDTMNPSEAAAVVRIAVPFPELHPAGAA